LSKVSRLLLTNGIVDGWSIASILEKNVSSGVEVVNMVNGAHHSDLSHTGPSESDTPDVIEAFERIAGIIGDWLVDVRSAMKYDD
jgi:Serine carboxypeptidase S28